MCGLIAFIATKDSADAKEAIMTQFQEQIHRGKEGFGIIDIDHKNLAIHRAVEPTKAYFDLFQSIGRVILFHHRNPTSTKNTLKQTHPILVSHEMLDHDYYVMHNGVISNSRDLRGAHEEEGFAYTTATTETYTSGYYTKTEAYSYERFNDTESFAIELAKVLDGEAREVKALGSMAFIAVQVDKETKLAKKIMWGRNDRNPLSVEQRPNGLLIASEIDTEKAEEVFENTYEVLDLSILKKKVLPQDIIAMLEVKNIAFAKPEPKADPKVPAPAQHSHIGFNYNTGAGIRTAPPGPGPTSADDKYNGFTPRETAFMKMSERMSDAFWPQMCQTLDELFLHMAEHEMSEDDIEEYMIEMIADLQQAVLKKEELARERLRPMFDRREDAEDAKIREEDERALAEMDEKLAVSVDADNSYGLYDDPGFTDDFYGGRYELPPSSSFF